MKIIVVISITLALFTHSLYDGQIKIPSKFSEVSYYILGVADLQPSAGFFSGSGFFIRDNNKLFLITAKHVLSGCSDSVNKFRVIRNEAIIFLGMPNTNADFLNIDISKILDTASCDKKLPDFVCIEINSNYNNANIVSFEKYIIPPLVKEDTIKIFGFPGIENQKHPSGYGYVPPSTITLPKNKYTFYGDTINYYLRIDSTQLDSNYGGFSGSPVFLKDANSDKWRLIGLFTATIKDLDNSKYAYLLITKIEYVIADLYKKSRN